MVVIKEIPAVLIVYAKQRIIGSWIRNTVVLRSVIDVGYILEREVGREVERERLNKRKSSSLFIII